MKFGIHQTCISILLIGTLAACGGGGSGSNSNSSSTTGGGTPVESTGTGTGTSTSTIVTSVSAATYAMGSANAIIYAQLNSVRASIGSGLLTENADLDKSAAAHLNYVAINGVLDPSFHFEAAGQSGFTGVDVGSREIAAGYGIGVASETGYSQLAAGAAQTQCVNAWADSVYHVAALLVGYRDVGVAAGDSPLPSMPSATASTCVVDLGVQANVKLQYPATKTLLIYPYDGQTGVATSFNNLAEEPTPVPDLSGVGQPITVNLSANVTAVSVFNLKDASGSVVPTRILAPSGTTGPGVVVDSYVNSSFVTLVPTSALSPNTTYTVTFSGTANSTVLSKNWSFTTGALGNSTTNI